MTPASSGDPIPSAAGRRDVTYDPLDDLFELQAPALCGGSESCIV
jgi:hypothetical protein